MKVLVYGGGQLARMMYLAGCPLGIHVRAVDVNKDQVINPISKAPSTVSLEQAIDDASVITVEFEHIPDRLLEKADETGKLKPGIIAIKTGADRVKEKALMTHLDIPTSEYKVMHSVAELDEIANQLGTPLVLKASRDGYDGYGQWRLKDKASIPEMKKQLSSLDLHAVPIIVEKMISFSREVSLVGVRSKTGAFAFYPLVENHHYEGQLHLTVAPAPHITDELQQQAQDIFTKLAEKLDYVGVMAVEFFQVGDELMVNEIAPRVHNSGHWTMQGADTCQFENHLRAIFGLPLGSTELRSTTAMVNIIGCGSFSRDMLGIPGCHIHWYGKTARAKRKLGHFNVSASDTKTLAERLAELATHLPEESFPILKDRTQRLQEY